MNFFSNSKKIISKKSEAGFTLIEMIVSVGLFSIVMVIMLGAVLTIVDVNRKSQTLTTVMNNLNFALESMTRTIKTGHFENPYGDPYNKSIKIIDQDGEKVIYAFVESNDLGRIEKNSVPITSSQIDIDSAKFDLIYDSSTNKQPRVLINIEGRVSIGPKIFSEFSLQTTVSPRDLNI